MHPDEFVEFFGTHKASAILRTPIAEAAEPAMEAALRAGFQVIEFTMTTPGALGLIGQFSKRSGIVVGAGTVLTPDEAKAAVAAGARFLVSPVVDETVIETAAALALHRDQAVIRDALSSPAAGRIPPVARLAAPG